MFEMDLIQINRPPAPPNEGVSAAGKGFPSSRKEGDQATSDGSTPNRKATEPDDVLIERAAHRNHQREG
jgi:hypothetical protein